MDKNNLTSSKEAILCIRRRAESCALRLNATVFQFHAGITPGGTQQEAGDAPGFLQRTQEPDAEQKPKETFILKVKKAKAPQPPGAHVTGRLRQRLDLRSHIEVHLPVDTVSTEYSINTAL